MEVTTLVEVRVPLKWLKLNLASVLGELLCDDGTDDSTPLSCTDDPVSDLPVGSCTFDATVDATSFGSQVPTRILKVTVQNSKVRACERTLYKTLPNSTL